MNIVKETAHSPISYNPVNRFFSKEHYQQLPYHFMILYFDFVVYFSMSTSYSSFVAGRPLLFYTSGFCFSCQLLAVCESCRHIDVANNVLYFSINDNIFSINNNIFTLTRCYCLYKVSEKRKQTSFNVALIG